MTGFPTYKHALAQALARTDVPDGYLPVLRWYLHHATPDQVIVPAPPRGDLAITHKTPITVADYRALYNAVGTDWLWAGRRRLDDNALAEAIAGPAVSVHVLSVAGTPAGFFELDIKPAGRTNLAYFGLMPGFTGQKLGPYMLAFALNTAWQRKQSPVSIDTCTLDSPGALATYQRGGFEIVRTDDEVFADPRREGLIPLDKAPHIPLAPIQNAKNR